MSLPISVTAAFLDKIVGVLAPLFLATTAGDVAAARDASRGTLMAYHARGSDELRLVALTIAFGFGALEALSQAANPDLSPNVIMRLRNNATAFSRAGHQHQAVLDKRHTQAATEPAPEPEPVSLELTAGVVAADVVPAARPVSSARPRSSATAAPLSRQQRRAIER